MIFLFEGGGSGAPIAIRGLPSFSFLDQTAPTVIAKRSCAEVAARVSRRYFQTTRLRPDSNGRHGGSCALAGSLWTDDYSSRMGKRTQTRFRTLVESGT